VDLLGDLLKSVLDNGWSLLLLAIVTIAPFITPITPLGDFIKKRLHLPYWCVWLIRKKSKRIVFWVARSHSDTKLGRIIDRRLYLLHGDYKKLGIVSNKSGTIGSPDEFDHNPKITVIHLDNLLRSRLSNLGDERLNIRVLEILDFWQPHLLGEINSKIIEVVQFSILCSLGFDIPFEWKLSCSDYIRTYFMMPYIKTGNISKQELLDLVQAEEFLMKLGENLREYEIESDDFVADFIFDMRTQHLTSNPISWLLADSKRAFNEYGDEKNKRGVR
jgi:hypothetical protein